MAVDGPMEGAIAGDDLDFLSQFVQPAGGTEQQEGQPGVEGEAAG